MVTIRELQNNEFEFLTDMFYESIYIPENKPRKDVLINAPHLKKYHEGWGRTGDAAFIAVNANNEALGAVWYRMFDENNKGYGYVDSHTPELGIAVTELARGKGVGTLLMKEIMQQAICSGYTSISLSVDSKNKYAVHLYKKLGFEECGVDGTSITMIYRNSEEIEL